jgi:hypothetical protein
MLFVEFEEKFADKCRKVGQLHTVCWSAEGEITEQNMASHLAAASCHVRDSNAESTRTLYSAAHSRTDPTKFVAFR